MKTETADPLTAEEDGVPAAYHGSPGYWRQSLRQLLRYRMGQVGAVLVLLVVIPALLAPWIAPHDPLLQNDGLELTPPGGEFLFGTDEFGRDVLSRVMYGGRASLLVGVVAVTFGAGIGLALGMVAGYRGGLLDMFVSRALDVLQAFPAILIGISVVAVRGPGIGNVALAIAVYNVPIFARLARAGTMSVKRTEFVEVAVSMGARTSRLLRHIFPNILSPILAQIGVAMAVAVLLESGLSFLGLGAQPPDPSWGQMLSTAQGFLRDAPWYAVFPGLALTVLLVGLSLLVDAVRDVLDPRSSRQTLEVSRGGLG